MNMTILVLDDELDKRQDLSKHLKSEGYTVYTAATVEAAKQSILVQELDFAIIDLKIDYSSDYGGITVIEYINKNSPKTKVIVLSAYEKDSVIEEQLEKITYYGYVSKGGTNNYIRAVIEELEKLKTKKKCFVIMPFSSTRNCSKDQWLDIFETMIKPAVEESGFNFECFRADLVIGNIIRDILDNLYKAEIVIADLTDRNANVFYELGVRHAFGNATILIAQDIKHIPFDLHNYATLIYDWTTAKGKDDFKQRIKKILAKIEADPNDVNVMSPINEYLKL